MKKNSVRTIVSILCIVGALLLAACTYEEPVASPVVSGLVIEPQDMILSPGESVIPHVTAFLSNNQSVDVTACSNGTFYTSSDESIATIDSLGQIHITPEALSGDTVRVLAEHEGHSASLNITVKYSLEDTVKLNEDEIAVVTNFLRTDVLVNKERSLPSDYIPTDLVEPNVPLNAPAGHEKRQMREEAARALEQLFAAAKDAGHQLYGISGYRSYKLQERVFNSHVKSKGLEQARKISAYPGQSEHQTGLAMDVSSKSVNYRLHEEFGEMPEGIWLRENAHLFGFIIRYPLGMEDITGYSYEPWHVRYVGTAMATEIYDQGITLEEYFIR